MPLLDQIRANKLELLALRRFDDQLCDAELNILVRSASSFDPPELFGNAPKPAVRAEFLRWLATDPEVAPYIDPKGLRARTVTVNGDLDLKHCRIGLALDFRLSHFTGEVKLEGATVRSVYFDSSQVCGVTADEVVIAGSLSFRYVTAGAEIRLIGAEVHGNLDCTGAKLHAQDDALSADGARIFGDLILRRNFECPGTIRLIGAEIKGDLDCRGASIGKMSCQNTNIEGNLLWQGIKNPSAAELVLSGTKVKNFRDDMESRPGANNLDLEGLEYEELILHKCPTEKEIKENRLSDEFPLDAAGRVKWILRQKPEQCCEAQPWMHLRALLEKKGDRKGAEHVLFCYRRFQARRLEWHPLQWISKRVKFAACLLWGMLTTSAFWSQSAPYLRHPSRAWHIAFAWVEENPFRIGWSIALTLLIGTSVFAWGGRDGAMTESVRLQPNAMKDNGEARPISSHYPKYQPFVYTLENTVPLVRLGMDDKWTPDPAGRFCWPWFPSVPWLYFVSTYGVLVFTRWSLIVWGWVQATVLAAALADRFKK